VDRRPHLSQHARLGDVGIVVPSSRQAPQMASLYVIVHFEQCGHDHRLLRDEIAEV
jgi:hypothetical protein